MPSNYDLFSYTGPGRFRAPGEPSPKVEPKFLRYPDMLFGASLGKVFLIVTEQKGAHLANGVTIGGALSSAQRAFPSLRCATATDAHGAPTHPYCRGKIGPQRFLYVGGDPIRSLAVSTVPLDASTTDGAEEVPAYAFRQGTAALIGAPSEIQ